MSFYASKLILFLVYPFTNLQKNLNIKERNKFWTNLPFVEPCIARCVFYITNEMQLIQCSLLLLSALYMFRALFPPIIRSL